MADGPVFGVDARFFGSTETREEYVAGILVRAGMSEEEAATVVPSLAFGLDGVFPFEDGEPDSVSEVLGKLLELAVLAFVAAKLVTEREFALEERVTVLED